MNKITLKNGMMCPAGRLTCGVEYAVTIPALMSWCDLYSHDAYMELLERPRVDDELFLFMAHPDQATNVSVEDLAWFEGELRTIMNNMLPDTHHARQRAGGNLGVPWFEFGIWRKS